MRLFVAIATTGRPEIVESTVNLLASQTRPPDGIVVVAVTPADVGGLKTTSSGLQIAFSQMGGCNQRNHALDLIAGHADVVTFFDDDFVPAANYLENVERLFSERPDVVGITGDLVADGIHEPRGFSVEQSLKLIRERAGDLPTAIRKREALYGCNMSIRLSAATGLRFDEMLPLYSWQEDIDFTYQLGWRGLLISTGLVTGVHMGSKRGRSPGKRFGYSQVANIIYLQRKGTMQPKLGEKLLYQNLSRNLLRSIKPEPHIDRRGRLLGNMIALKDWALGRIDPRRIETM